MTTRTITDDLVREAMRDAWNEIVSDTGCHPLDIENGGRGRLTFRPSHWADFTAARLRALLLRGGLEPHDAGWVRPDDSDAAHPQKGGEG